jgi:hypothetical protein
MNALEIIEIAQVFIILLRIPYEHSYIVGEKWAVTTAYPGK